MCLSQRSGPVKYDKITIYRTILCSNQRPSPGEGSPDDTPWEDQHTHTHTHIHTGEVNTPTGSVCTWWILCGYLPTIDSLVPCHSHRSLRRPWPSALRKWLRFSRYESSRSVLQFIFRTNTFIRMSYELSCWSRLCSHQSMILSLSLSISTSMRSMSYPRAVLRKNAATISYTPEPAFSITSITLEQKPTSVERTETMILRMRMTIPNEFNFKHSTRARHGSTRLTVSKLTVSRRVIIDFRTNARPYKNAILFEGHASSSQKWIVARLHGSGHHQLVKLCPCQYPLNYAQIHCFFQPCKRNGIKRSLREMSLVRVHCFLRRKQPQASHWNAENGAEEILTLCQDLRTLWKSFEATWKNMPCVTPEVT